MAEAQSDPASRAGNPPTTPAANRPRRRRPWLWLPLLVVGGWYGGKALVRWHVDSLMQGAVGRPLPDFRLQDDNGARWSPAQLRGRPAVLHFFRSRCEACDREAADYRRFEQAVRPGRATILHVCTDGVLGYPPAETAATIAAKGFTRPVLVADEAFVSAFHTVTWSHVTPVTYVVDGGGIIRGALRGAQPMAELMAALATAE